MSLLDSCPPCEAGHTTHETKTLSIRLLGQHLRDSAIFPKRLSIQFPFTVFAWEEYQDLIGFCAGKDELSKSVDLQGVWDSYGTLLTLMLLRPGDTFIDFGSHVGWYSVIASHLGCRVIAYECNPENNRLFRINVPDEDNVTLIEEWVDANTLSIDPRQFKHDIRLVKMDIESWENHAVRVIQRLLYYKMVNYIMMEVSPIFADHYPATVQRVLDAGYQSFIIPGKGSENEFSADPLGVTFATPFTISDIAQTQQADILFVRNDLVGK